MNAVYTMFKPIHLCQWC